MQYTSEQFLVHMLLLLHIINVKLTDINVSCQSFILSMGTISSQAHFIALKEESEKEDKVLKVSENYAGQDCYGK